MSDFKWAEHKYRINMPFRWGKLVKKIPMKQQVINDRNELFEYHFLPDGRIRWVYLGSIRRTATINIE